MVDGLFFTLYFIKLIKILNTKIYEYVNGLL
jgi:hypothetical protein